MKEETRPGVHAAFGQHFAKTGLLDAKYHRWLLDTFDERLQSDYNFQANLNIASVGTRIEQAWAFLAETRQYLANSG